MVHMFSLLVGWWLKRIWLGLLVFLLFSGILNWLFLVSGADVHIPVNMNIAIYLGGFLIILQILWKDIKKFIKKHRAS